MAKKHSSQKQMRHVVGSIGPEDGVDPRDVARGLRKPDARGRKTLQLCNQIFETLEQVLAEQEDEVLQGLHVVSVVPAPDESNVLVTVSPGAGVTPLEIASLQERLDYSSKELRMEVASAITRRKVPGITWRVAVG
jgi:ribosome-binding factor A